MTNMKLRISKVDIKSFQKEIDEMTSDLTLVKTENKSGRQLYWYWRYKDIEYEPIITNTCYWFLKGILNGLHANLKEITKPAEVTS